MISKEAKRKYDKLRYLRLKKQIKARVSAYQKANRARINLYWRKRRAENPNTFQKYTTAYRKENPWQRHYECAKARCENPHNVSFIRYGARGIEFHLTMSQVKRLWFRDKAYELLKPSLDRKKNDENYTYGNCQFIEQSLNSSLRQSRAIALEHKRRMEKLSVPALDK